MVVVVFVDVDEMVGCVEVDVVVEGVTAVVVEFDVVVDVDVDVVGWVLVVVVVVDDGGGVWLAHELLPDVFDEIVG